MSQGTDDEGLTAEQRAALERAEAERWGQAEPPEPQDCWPSMDR